MVSSYVLVKSIAFFTGFVFFSDPLIWRGIAYLNREYPHWQKFLEIQKQVSVATLIFSNFVADSPTALFSRVFPQTLK